MKVRPIGHDVASVIARSITAASMNSKPVQRSLQHEVLAAWKDTWPQVRASREKVCVLVHHDHSQLGRGSDGQANPMLLSFINLECELPLQSENLLQPVAWMCGGVVGDCMLTCHMVMCYDLCMMLQ